MAGLREPQREHLKGDLTEPQTAALRVLWWAALWASQKVLQRACWSERKKAEKMVDH